MGRLTEFFAARNKPSTRRRSHLSPASMPRRLGPLEKGYDPTGLPFRMRCGDRVVQLIVEMKKLHAASDYAGFAANLPELRLIHDALHEPGWADDLFDELWPDWRRHAKNHHENQSATDSHN